MNQYLKYIDSFKKIYDDSEIKIDENMSNHIHFKVGGPVDILLIPSKVSQVVETLKICKNENIPYFIIGNGSNLLVKDGGIRGVVIKLSNLLSIEVNGIPGSVGGAVFMNAGAYDGEIKNVIKEAEVLDRDGNIKVLSKEELELGYRTSKVMKDNLVVISATFELTKGDKEKIRERVNELTEKRESKQPLEYPSAGSTFKRPEGYFAGKLIQDAGLKGASLGGAAVSEKHSGFVINKDGATAEDVLNLIAHVQNEVKKQFGVELHTEVRIIGEDK
ncbi:MAG: UDP-N-acetylmuramate dehydrogenase [Clostridium sp.]|nr:UDP-N-acetylmuramate dehydrogenase [Clostridium sp.]